MNCYVTFFNTNQNTRLGHVLSVLNETHVHIIICTYIPILPTQRQNIALWITTYKIIASATLGWVVSGLLYTYIYIRIYSLGCILNNGKIIHLLLTLLNQYQTTSNHNNIEE